MITWMTPEELQKYYQSKYPHKDALNQEELDWISSQEDIDWAIDNILQARQNKNTEELYKRNRRYWANPIKNIFNNWIEGKPIKDIFKGTNERWSASLDNNNNPINGLVNVGLPAAALTSAVMNPFGTAGAIALGGAATLAGDAAINSITDGKYVSVPGFIQDETGLSRLTSELVNPLMLLGGKHGYKGGTNIGSKLFNGLHLPIGYDPVGGWYKRRPYSRMQETPVLSSIPSVVAGPLEIGQKPVAVMPATTNASIPASARRVLALSAPAEIPSSGVSIVTPPTDLSRGTWDFYRSAMQENPVLALPSVQAWLQQYGDVRTPQQWMLAGTRNLNLQSGTNNPRSVLYRAFGNVYGRNGVYRGTMPPFAPDVQPMRYEFTPGLENPLVGQFRIVGQPPFEYNISNLPFRADFLPVIRGGWGNRQYTGDPVMRLAADITTLTRGEGNSYLDIFARPLALALRRRDNHDLFMRGLLPRRGTVRQLTIGGRPFTIGTNIFGEPIIHRVMPDENGTFTRRWTLMPNLDTEFFNGEDLIPHFNNNINIGEFIRNLGPLTEEGAQLEAIPEMIQVSPDGTFNPVKLKLFDPFSGPSQNRGLALPGNMGHYQLKSLMQGSPLEKQVSKNGEINVNNLLTYIQKNGSSVELSVIQEVIQSKFPNQKSVNYQMLKALISHELIRYLHGSSSLYDTYGILRLGYTDGEDWVGAVLDKSFKPTVYLMESDRIPAGQADHYNANTLGHIRTAIDLNEPNVLYVLESQSDWGQRIELTPEQNPMLSAEFRKEFEELGNMLAEYAAGNKRPLEQSKYNGDLRMAKGLYYKWRMMLNGEEGGAKHYGATPQQIHLHKNYQTKQIQEAVLIAARNGLKKLRFPVEDTAAKIEGFKPLKQERRYVNGVELEFEDLQIQLDPETGVYTAVYPDEAEIRVDYPSRIKTILKKYSDFPKMWKKLFKTEPRIVTDSKGNTWYEVDVPEGYLDQEWQFKMGGKLNYLTMFR